MNLLNRQGENKQKKDTKVEMEMIEETKLLINEESFKLEITAWNPITIELLESYADWKCNGHNETGQKPDDITWPHPTDKKPDKTKTILPIKNKGQPIFSEKDMLAKPGEYGSMAIYHQIMNHILDTAPEPFNHNDLADIILKFYKNKLNKTITMGTAQVYSSSYRRYMTDNNIITIGNEGNYQRKTDKKEPEKNNKLQQQVEENKQFLNEVCS